MFTLLQLCINYLLKNQHLIDEDYLPDELIEKLEIRRILQIKTIEYPPLSLRQLNKDDYYIDYLSEDVIRYCKSTPNPERKIPIINQYIVFCMYNINRNRSRYNCTYIELALILIKRLGPDQHTLELIRLARDKFLIFIKEINPYYFKRSLKLLNELNSFLN